MAKFRKKIDRLRATVPGRIIETLIYAAMLILVMVYFTGNGVFIYEF